MATPDLTDALRGLGLDPVAARGLLDAAEPVHPRHPGEPLATEDEPATSLLLVESGVLKAFRSLDNGATQTVALFTHGDIVGGQALALGRQTSTVAAVTAARVAAIPLARLRPLMAANPSIADALWRATAREAAVLQEWLLGMGRRAAYAQMAHLLCEMAVRMRHANRVRGENTYDFPLTQGELADLVGLSAVHVNRVLQSLRADGLIRLRRGELIVDNWRLLVEAGDFDPAYLDLSPPPPGGPNAAVLLSLGDAGGTRGR